MHEPRQISPEIRAPGDEAARRKLLALLIAMTAIAPLSLNILMPSLPGLSATFASDAGIVQLALSLYLLGMATSQLVLGPLSDRFGRRPVMLAGLTITMVMSLAGMLATSIGTLILARVLQALGATAGAVIGRAIIRDLYDRDRAASMIGWVTMAMVVAPMVSPLIGGALDTALGWQATFAFVGIAAAAVLCWAAFALPETRAVAVGESPVRLLEEAGTLIVSRNFLGYALCAAFNSATFFAFLGGAPHVVVTIMGRSSAEYGIWFAASALAYMMGNFVAARWSPSHGIDAMIRAGVIMTVLGGIVALACILLEPRAGPAVVFLPQMIIGFASGFTLPNTIAGAVSVRPRAAGAASGITGFLQMGTGAAAAQLVGLLIAGATTALPMTLVILGCSVGALVVYFGLVRRESH